VLCDVWRGAKSYERIHEARIKGGRRARTKGFTQNKECKYKVDGVDSEKDGDGWMMHIRWTPYNARTLNALEAPQAIPVRG